MKNKKSLLLIGVIVTNFLISYIVAQILRAEYLEIGQLQNPELIAERYQAIVLKSYNTFTYLTIGLSICIVIAFGFLGSVKNRILNWVIGLLLGVAYFVIAVIYFAITFNDIL